MPAAIYAPKNSLLSPAKLREAVEALLAYAKKTRAGVDVSLVGNAAIRRLNKTYRRKDRVTDVLSFPLDSRAPKHGGPWHLGEIVISLPVAKLQAKSAGRRPVDQVIRLAVHGLVHLSGLDHEASERGKKKFQSLEKKWLTYLKKKRLLTWDGSLQF